MAAVDAEDKIACYRNWLGLMKGDLKVQFEKNGKNLERKLNPDRSNIAKEGKGSNQNPQSEGFFAKAKELWEELKE